MPQTIQDDLTWVIDQHKAFLNGRQVPPAYYSKLHQIAILIRELRQPDNGGFWMALRRQGDGLLTIWQYLKAPYGMEGGDIYWDIEPDTIDAALAKLLDLANDT